MPDSLPTVVDEARRNPFGTPPGQEPRFVFGPEGLVMSDATPAEQRQSFVAANALEAARLRQSATWETGDRKTELMADAAGLDAEAFMPLRFRNPVATAGGELPLNVGPDDPGCDADRAMTATVRNPDLVKATADVRRLRNAQDTGSLELALDVATELRAKSNLERMVIQAMSASYNGANKLQGAAIYHVNAGGGNDAYRERTSDLHDSSGIKTRHFDAMANHNTEAAKLSNAAQKAFQSFFMGVQTLALLRRGGRQKIKVVHQYVNVGDGGQAVVAQNMKMGRGKVRRGSARAGVKNRSAGQTP